MAKGIKLAKSVSMIAIVGAQYDFNIDTCASRCSTFARMPLLRLIFNYAARDVCLGSKADIRECVSGVRLTPPKADRLGVGRDVGQAPIGDIALSVSSPAKQRRVRRCLPPGYGCGRGVLATLGGRIGYVTFGWSPVKDLRKATIFATCSSLSDLPSWSVAMMPTA
jgi:hypothetical protein